MARSLILALALALAPPALQAQPAPLPNASVLEMDVHRYGGTWHEIAHLPMFFQRKCVADITATYTPRPDGKVGVRNACATRDGRQIVSQGTARAVAGHPGRLEVRFVPDWLAWAPMVWAEYWVLELDPEYRWAVVGGPDRKYLWVLSRTPTMQRSVFEGIRERAARRGYPVANLVMAAPLVD